MQSRSPNDEIVNEKKLKSQLRKMLHETKKEKSELKHKVRKELRKIRQTRESVKLPTWLPPDQNESSAGSSGSINMSVSRRLSTYEVEEARAHMLIMLNKREEQLKKQVYSKMAKEYFKNIDFSHEEGKAKVENRKIRASKAFKKRDFKKEVERRPYAKHDTSWKMKTNAGNIIMRAFVGNGPSPPSDMPVLKEGTDIWPVIPDRTGCGRLPGKPSWYRTQNGNLFGDQKLENFAEHYKKIVIRNKKIKERNDILKKSEEEKRLAIEKVRALRKKPKRPWSATGGGRVFSMLTSIRPPTHMERQKMNALPSRALAGHTVNGNPKWKCR
jgi:hypothetical protein